MLRSLLLCASAVSALRIPWSSNNNGHLVMLYGPDEDYSCEKMAPLVKWIEGKENTKFVKIDVYADQANWKLLQFLEKDYRGKSRCYALPYFYNRNTGGVISGATNYVNFDRWATGKEHKEMDSVGNSVPENARELRVTGLKARKKRLEYADMERRGLDTTIRKYT
ncbi:hypothetical protein M885DRAFT_543249 [Pelagophyceae sp. CCMP2097]|nr:hypothetical protein M885DRAFT_543249 [Pelagophyceae sp. CCMP2097]